MKKALVLGLFVGSLAVFLLILFFPPSDDFNLDNPFWNGLKEFKEEIKPESLSRIFNIDSVFPPSETVLFIIGPSGAYSRDEIVSLSRYLEKGGTVVLADDFGSGNLILKNLGIKTSFSHHLVVDPLFRGKSSVLVKAVDMNEDLSSIKSLMFNYPTSVQFESDEGKVLTTSSPFSFFDDNMNGKKEKEENSGPFPMIVKLSYGKGKIFLISDSSLFINSMLDKEENKKFLKSLVGKKKVFFDISCHPEGLLLKLRKAKIKIYRVFSRFEVKYSIFLILVIIFMWLRFEGKENRKEHAEDVDNILQRHPEWNREILKNLRSRFKI